jgi:hypothetical protein
MRLEVLFSRFPASECDSFFLGSVSIHTKDIYNMTTTFTLLPSPYSGKSRVPEKLFCYHFPLKSRCMKLKTRNVRGKVAEVKTKKKNRQTALSPSIESETLHFSSTQAFSVSNWTRYRFIIFEQSCYFYPRQTKFASSVIQDNTQLNLLVVS